MQQPILGSIKILNMNAHVLNNLTHMDPKKMLLVPVASL
jgi:hypothetical protein